MGIENLIRDDPCCTHRLYETGSNEPQLQQVWPLGRQPTASLSSGPRLPFLVGLGDTAVDFDFAPPVPSGNVSYSAYIQVQSAFLKMPMITLADLVVAEACSSIFVIFLRKVFKHYYYYSYYYYYYY
jgi:hypothetical protein